MSLRREVALLGATGLVGSELLRQLLEDEGVERVVVATRRPTGIRHPRLDERVFPLEEMEGHADACAVGQIFCALGTTIRTAGSKERFREVDHDFPLAAARLGLGKGAQHFLLVSALGADARSFFFYNRVKGRLEDDLRSLGYPRLTLARPSLLLGERRERRLGEQVGARLAFLVPGPWAPIPAAVVARALVALAREDALGVRVIESGEMRRRFGS